VAADDDEGFGRSPANATGEIEHVVHFEGVHASDTNDSRAVTLEVELDRSREAQIENVDVVSPGYERPRDVLHPQRLDSKERPQTESLVAGDRADEQNLHREARGGYHQPGISSNMELSRFGQNPLQEALVKAVPETPEPRSSNDELTREDDTY
jgi:hypothetical protein